MSRKVSVLVFSEGYGMYTKGTKDKAEAVKAMQEYARHEYEIDPDEWLSDNKFHPIEISELTVEATRYYKCRDCSGDTIGDDNLCFECGDTIGTVGRHCFAFIKNPTS